MSDDIKDWFDAGLRPATHKDRRRLLAEFGIVIALVPPDVRSWLPLREEATRRLVSATISGDDAGARFWALAAQEFGDRQDLLLLSQP